MRLATIFSYKSPPSDIWSVFTRNALAVPADRHTRATTPSRAIGIEFLTGGCSDPFPNSRAGTIALLCLWLSPEVVSPPHFFVIFFSPQHGRRR